MSEPNTTQASPPAILFVDDEATAVKYFQRAIGSMAAVVTGGSVAEGKVLLDTHAGSLSVLVSDQRMPGEYGNELLRYAREKYPHIVRILTTAYSEIEQTVEAVNEGEIHRYIRKPWDITALRMELKQALEISGLRKERDQLVREKLGVLQRQTIAARIGMVQALTASLIGLGRFQPVETYLSTSALAGVVNPEPDWLRMDYADLVGAESQRSGGFGHAVATRLAELRGQPAGDPLDVIARALGDGASRRSGDALVLTAPELFGEYLSRPVGEAVSPVHAGWLAGLLRIEESGMAVTASREGTEIVLRASVPTGSFSADRLAIWIEQF